MNRERAELEALAGLHLVQVGVFKQSVLVEFIFDVRKRELRAPHRHVEFGKNPGQRADVIFVAMGEEYAPHPLPVLNEIRNIRDHDIDAEQFSLREHEARIDHNNVVTPAYGHAVHTELAEAPEGDNLQFSSWHQIFDASTDGVSHRTEGCVYGPRPIAFSRALS